jgi:hypothetical protein
MDYGAPAWSWRSRRWILPIVKLRTLHVGNHPIRRAVSTRRRTVGRYHCTVTELRVTVPEETAERLASEAADRGSSAEDVAAEVLRLHAPHRRGPNRFGFISIGQTRPGFSARRAEESLEAEGFV